MSQERAVLFQQWLGGSLKTDQFTLEPLAGDASFRRYSRVRLNDGRTFMAMDAPTYHENSEPFVAVLHMFMAHNVHVPYILNEDLTQGFLLLEDFGDILLSQRLNNETVDHLYAMALRQLIGLQHAPQTSRYPLPYYSNEKLLSEMQLFDTWFIPHFLELELSSTEYELLQQTYQTIIDLCNEQPQVVVHRDYHCRNLMVISPESTTLGIIDFQDAVIGPITYDAVSLLRDAYVQWSPEQVDGWVAQFLVMQQQAGYLGTVAQETFKQWFDIMGAQRHLKVLGIFVRLCMRDGKTGYLKDLPLVLWYLLVETKQLPMLAAFHLWLSEKIVPAFIAKVPTSATLFESV